MSLIIIFYNGNQIIFQGKNICLQNNCKISFKKLIFSIILDQKFKNTKIFQQMIDILFFYWFQCIRNIINFLKINKIYFGSQIYHPSQRQFNQKFFSIIELVSIAIQNKNH
ncbi:hypothetical protein TTHERM_000998909 (macronuclear) [Tetrahymena thermophila SB210]|uniref:Uncharacterized protein n=1 Tax=Tetrahymena thermophila (strain SB210) TaxID=312017 RepID=W7XHD6_TETTS|nr:hypothetical protein TTHERM_000998909 [Tetrahymena thermophila SB210]EWS73766.1 hypothetical protein TTHERM_000998909 [Tetrahymena thermophila SB210]|eukprot:XP_012653697.1 hypothetical protein TTHERM_000998909 [Tetrahymena thermophila SB210]